MKTNQEAFNHVWDAINKQQAPSRNFNGCYYRIGDKRCAAGFLIKEDCEALVKNQDKICNWLVDYLGVNPFDCDDVDFVSQLQNVHDGAGDVPSFLPKWREGMVRLAKKYNLTVPPIPTS